MNLTVITPEGIIFKGQVECAMFPGTMGIFTIWSDHAALMSGLTSGNLRYITEGHNHEITLQHGFVEIRNNNILACIVTQERKHWYITKLANKPSLTN